MTTDYFDRGTNASMKSTSESANFGGRAITLHTPVVSVADTAAPAVLGATDDAAWDESASDATLVALGKAAALALGLQADANWDLSGSGSAIAILKQLALAIGDPSDTKWDGSAASASLIAIAKKIAAP